MLPARQCLSEQNALDNLDSKKVTQQKRLGVMAMAGGSEEYAIYLGCGYTFEDDQGGSTWGGEVIIWTLTAPVKYASL